MTEIRAAQGLISLAATHASAAAKVEAMAVLTAVAIAMKDGSLNMRIESGWIRPIELNTKATPRIGRMDDIRPRGCNGDSRDWKQQWGKTAAVVMVVNLSLTTTVPMKQTQYRWKAGYDNDSDGLASASTQHGNPSSTM